MRVQFVDDGSHSDFRRKLLRKPVCACRYGGKRDSLGLAGGGQSHRLPIAACQKAAFIRISALPNRPDGMDQEFSRQAVASGNARLSCRAPAKLFAICQEFRSRFEMNRSIHASAAKQRLVRSVYNDVDLEFRDIAVDKLNFARFSHLSPNRLRIDQMMVGHMPVPVKIVLSGNIRQAKIAAWHRPA